jgi:hypothetical protein
MARRRSDDPSEIIEDPNLDENDPDGGGPEDGSEEQQVPEPDNGLPIPTDDELDAVDELEKTRDNEHEAAIIESNRKLMNLATAYPKTTPNEQVVMGLGAHKLTVGDLRRVAVHVKRTHRGE